jgi:SPP1 family predicted phage head-tail adaptor
MKSINAGELNQRIQLVRIVPERHVEGYYVANETVVHECWAKVSRVSGSELVKANAGFGQEKIRALIRYTAKDLGRGLVLRHRGRDYDLSYINPYPGSQYVELWGERLEMDTPHTVTLFNAAQDADAPNMTLLRGVYVDRKIGADVASTGLTNADSVQLYIPVLIRAYNVLTGAEQHYMKPKAYQSKADKSKYWTVDTGAGVNSCFFALGEITEQARYQTINQKYDDVFRVSGAILRTFGNAEAQYLEVTGR